MLLIRHAANVERWLREAMTQLHLSIVSHRFSRRTAGVERGITTSQAEAILGVATEIECGKIPEDSVAGFQECFLYKLAPGDCYQQWRYRRGNKSFYFWFAIDATGEWRLSAKAAWPSSIDRTR